MRLPDTPLALAYPIIFWALVGTLLLAILTGCGQHVDRPHVSNDNEKPYVAVLTSSTWGDSKGRGGCSGDGC